MGGCSVRNCKNRSKKGLRVFKVPTDPERRKLWLSLCKRTDCPDSAQVCEVHFDESQFELHRRDGWRKLKHNAVPTIFEPHARGLKIKKLPETVHSFSPEENSTKRNEIDDDGFYVKTNEKRCLICYQPVCDVFRTVSNEDRICSEFGRILLLLLKPSEATILTKYCCTLCSDNVMSCFTLLAEINLSTILTYRRIHKKTSEGSLTQDCPVCGSLYETRYALDQHFLQHLLNGNANSALENEPQKNDTRSNQNQGELLILSHVDDGVALVRNEHSYNKDKEWKSKECSLVCHVCGKSYKNRNNMTRHLKAHGQPILPKISKINRCQCEICGKWFKHKLSLRRHIRKSHVNYHTFSCIVCVRRFQNEKTLNRHFLSQHCDEPSQVSDQQKNDPSSIDNDRVQILETIEPEKVVNFMNNLTVVRTTSEISEHATDAVVVNDLVLDDLLNLSAIPNHFVRLENL